MRLSEAPGRTLRMSLLADELAHSRSRITHTVRRLEALAPSFRTFGAEPPSTLREIYRSFAADDAMLAALVETAPAVVSFHFGLPDAARIAALKGAGCLLLEMIVLGRLAMGEDPSRIRLRDRRTVRRDGRLIHHDALALDDAAPIIGSNKDPSSGRSRLAALICIPVACTKAGERKTIRRAGLKTSHACFSVVAPE